MRWWPSVTSTKNSNYLHKWHGQILVVQMRYFLGTLPKFFNGIGKDPFVFKGEFFILQPLRCFLAPLSYLCFLVPFSMWIPNHSFLHWTRYLTLLIENLTFSRKLHEEDMHAYTRTYTRAPVYTRTHARTHTHNKQWTLYLCFMLHTGIYKFFQTSFTLQKANNLLSFSLRLVTHMTRENYRRNSELNKVAAPS